MSRTWYQIRAAKRPRSAEIFIHDEIGEFGITSASFVADFKALGTLDEITLRINSPGGDCAQGVAIYNILKGSPARIIAVVDGIAASMASVIAMAGDRVLMPENTMMMIHDPIGLVLGTSHDMRHTADVIDKFGETLVTAYTNKTGLSAESVKDLMKAETWMSAKEAVAKRFADEVVQPVAIAARFDLSRFAHPPAKSGAAMASASMHRELARQGLGDRHGAQSAAAAVSRNGGGDATSLTNMRRQLAARGLAPSA